MSISNDSLSLLCRGRVRCGIQSRVSARRASRVRGLEAKAQDSSQEQNRGSNV